jgi:hypothetical protein
MSLSPRYPRCGISRARRGLRAALIDTAGYLHRLAAPPEEDDSARFDWLADLEAHHGLDLELVLTDGLARTDPLGRLALARNIPLWLAPDELLTAICKAARAQTRADDAAAILARLPACGAWRPHLRRVRSLNDPRQILLL